MSEELGDLTILEAFDLISEKIKALQEENARLRRELPPLPEDNANSQTRQDLQAIARRILDDGYFPGAGLFSLAEDYLKLCSQMAGANRVMGLIGPELERLRKANANIAGDSRCWLADAQAPLPPKEEFLESCKRFYDQTTARDGVLTGCRTISQLEEENQQLREENQDLKARLEGVAGAVIDSL